MEVYPKNFTRHGLICKFVVTHFTIGLLFKLAVNNLVSSYELVATSGDEDRLQVSVARTDMPEASKLLMPPTVTHPFSDRVEGC